VIRAPLAAGAAQETRIDEAPATAVTLVGAFGRTGAELLADGVEELVVLGVADSLLSDVGESLLLGAVAGLDDPGVFGVADDDALEPAIVAAEVVVAGVWPAVSDPAADTEVDGLEPAVAADGVVVAAVGLAGPDSVADTEVDAQSSVGVVANWPFGAESGDSSSGGEDNADVVTIADDDDRLAVGSVVEGAVVGTAVATEIGGVVATDVDAAVATDAGAGEFAVAAADASADICTVAALDATAVAGADAATGPDAGAVVATDAERAGHCAGAFRTSDSSPPWPTGPAIAINAVNPLPANATNAAPLRRDVSRIVKIPTVSRPEASAR
jgi:hypothetical protein